MPNDTLKFRRNFHIDVLIETRLKATLFRQWWPIVASNSSCTIPQLLFSPFKVLCFSLQFLLSPLLLDKTKNYSICCNVSVSISISLEKKKTIQWNAKTNLKLFCGNLWCWFSICWIYLTILIIGWEWFGRSLLCLTSLTDDRNCCRSIIIILKWIVFF